MSARVIILIILTAVATSFASARDKRPQQDVLYVFGVATCLGDSTVFVSPVQELSGERLNGQTDFLDNCHDYARQMEAHLLAEQGKHFTCAFFFEKNLKKAEKKFAAVFKRISKEYGQYVTGVPDSEFRFRFIAPSVPATTSAE